MRQAQRRLKASYLAGLSLPVLMFGTAITVKALPANEVEKIYYSDATRTEEVGGYTLGCDGDHSAWGSVTQYSSTSRTPCDRPGGLGPGPLPCEFSPQGCSPIPGPDGHRPRL